MPTIAKERTLYHPEREKAADGEAVSAGFAAGVNFYQLFWLFLLTAFLGCIAETVFMYLSRGQLQNRSGVIYGPFSLVWGFGAVVFTVLFHRLSGKGGLRIFFLGALTGAVYEYACSWLQEMLFGACFWDYSHLPFNINGRVNLVFSLFWGVAAVLWVKCLYPLLRRTIGKIPNHIGKPLTIALTVFMVFNVAVSAAALGRMNQREQGATPANAVEVFLDRRYPTARLQKIFTNLTYIGTDEARAAAGVPRPNDIPKR